MSKLKSIVFVAGIMLMILSMVMSYLSIRNLFTIVPANDYEDKGIYTFSPYQVLPVQIQNTGLSGRSRRMNPTKTVYMIYYKSTDGSGYQWTDRAISRELGQEIVDEGIPITRRVLSIPSNLTYITVEPDLTAKSYTAKLRQKYITILALSGAYILLYAATWCVIFLLRKKVHLNEMAKNL